MRATDPASDVSSSSSTVPNESAPDASSSASSRPRPASPRKMAANRANAARSTGPKSEQGKARSSMNAVRHGLAARAALLPGEDPAELEQLAREMEADLRPAGAAERELVGRVVSLGWRLRRVARAEEALWADDDADQMRRYEISMRVLEAGYPLLPGQSEDPPDPLPGARFVARQFSPHLKAASALERLAAYEQRLDRALHAALRQLQLLRKLRREAGEEDGDALPAAPRPVAETAAPPPPPEASVQNEPAADPVPEQGASDSAPGHAIPQNEPTAAEHESTGDAALPPALCTQNAQNEPTAEVTPAPGLPETARSGLEMSPASRPPAPGSPADGT